MRIGLQVYNIYKLNMDNISIGTILKGCGFILATSFCFANYKLLQSKRKQRQNFEKQEIRDLSDFQKMKQGESKYFKVKVQSNQTNHRNALSLSTPIHYNQYYLQEPSEANLVNSLLKSQGFEPIFKGKVWSFSDSSGRKVQIPEVRFILGDIFKVSHQYQKYQCGLLKKFWGGLCFYLQLFFDAVRKSKYQDPTIYHVDEKRRPFIMGPVVGMLHYSVGLITDSFFVLKVKFENGFHQAVLLAESKNMILGQYQLSVAHSKFGILFFGAFSLLFGHSLYKPIQNLIRRVQKGNKKFLEVQNIDQDKACVICYSNCRNLILFDCKHLIMCWNCWKTIKEANCPICKKQIKTAKVILSSKSKQQIDEEPNSQ